MLFLDLSCTQSTFSLSVVFPLPDTVEEGWKRVGSENPSSHLRYERVYSSLILCFTPAATREKAGEAKKSSLYNILLLSQRGFNLVETWSLHSSVLPLALSFTPSLSAYTNTLHKKSSDKLRLGLCFYCYCITVICFPAEAELPNTSNQIEDNQVHFSPLTSVYSGIWKFDHDLSWQLSARCCQSWIAWRGKRTQEWKKGMWVEKVLQNRCSSG